MALAKDPEINYAKSTGAFPMDPEPANVFVDSAIDYTKSTMAYPMYDTPAEVPVVLEHIGAETVVHFETPGPASFGDPAAIARQVEHLSVVVVDDAITVDNLEPPADADDESDEVVNFAGDVFIGAVGQAGEPETKQVDGDQAEAKVIEPPADEKPAGRTRARNK